MEAKGLRIGNLVILNNPKYRKEDTGIVHVIDQIKNDSVTIFRLDKLPYSFCYGQFINFIEPIPLTEDWLVKFGALQVKPRSGVNKTFKLYGVRIEMSNSGNFYHKGISKNSVHSIQNLIFALTGKELTI